MFFFPTYSVLNYKQIGKQKKGEKNRERERGEISPRDYCESLLKKKTGI